ncbi:SEM7A protein, partial [Erithacus rubecula]|nr:SEM7A protein [Erithacus rubecula]
AGARSRLSPFPAPHPAFPRRSKGTGREGCPPSISLRRVPSPGAKEYVFPRWERFPVFFHQENTSSIYVGGEGRLYYYDFATRENYTVRGLCQRVWHHKTQKKVSGIHLPAPIPGMAEPGSKIPQNSRDPLCPPQTQRKESPPWDGRGIAPFTPDSNTLVVVDGQDIYSTIKKSQQNGKIPRFRRVRGGGELYTSDTVMQNPQFVKATTLRHEEPHQDKIYYFFREDNPDKSPEAPRNISRVAQLCKEDKGGTSSLSASKWTTFLKATLICVDPVTKGNFNWLQDVFIVPAGDWRRSKVYGLFTNTWGSSAVCVYSFGDIDSVFRTSRLKGYSGPTPEVKPGQCVPSGQHTPSDTFKIADSHPEVEERVEPLGPGRSPLFHNKHRYQKIGVHEVAAAGGQRYNVLYLATDKGSIHKVVELPDGVQNIMEIQVFPNKDPIQSMILDHARVGPWGGLGGESGNLQIPADPPDLGVPTPETPLPQFLLVLIPIPTPRDVLQNLSLGSWRGNCQRGDVKEGAFRNISVTPFSRYYLNCSIESQYASYSWYHEDALVQSCNSSRPQPDCFHFIPSVRREHLGHYVCVSEEDGFRQELVKERLLDRQRLLGQRGAAPDTPPAPWLCLLSALLLAELFH